LIASHLAPLLLALDLAGTFVFGVSGAIAAIEKRLDLFGVMVLAFVTALAGGIVRDVLIGAIPPKGVADWRYPAVAFAAGAIVFVGYRAIKRLDRALLIFDAAGLSLFAVSGTQKALAYGLNPFMAALLGVMTAVGGGTLRDMLVAEVPKILRVEIYAAAALVGAVVVAVGFKLGIPALPLAIVGAAACFSLRIVSIWRRWSLPQSPAAFADG
jgi:uncharacterized membrane protein YeiH